MSIPGLKIKCEDLYDIANLSRQAHSQKKKRSLKVKPQTDEQQVLRLAKQIRKEHLPGAGARPIYKFIRAHDDYNDQVIGWSKHSFERLCLDNGMGVITKKYIPKTTVHGTFAFDNKIEGLRITDINKVWVSDICYIFGCLGKLIGYATCLIDLYSRFLLGLVFSRTMKAKDTVIPLIRQAYAIRQIPRYEETYFHSDAGKQYIAADFIELLRQKNIASSMARSCYENPFAESFNDVLKNHLLYDINLKSFNALKRLEKFIKHTYNHNKTHSGIDGMTPAAFELKLPGISLSKRAELEIKMID